MFIDIRAAVGSFKSILENEEGYEKILFCRARKHWAALPPPPQLVFRQHSRWSLESSILGKDVFYIELAVN